MTDLDEPMVSPQQRRDGVAAGVTVVVVLALVVAYFATRGDQPDAPARFLTSLTPEGPQPCGAGDLDTDTATGSTFLTTTLELGDDAEPCSVDGYPEVVVLSNGLPAGVHTVPDDTLGHPRELVVLPDRSVRVTIGWAPSHYCARIFSDAVRIRPAPGLTIEVPGFGPTSCQPGEGDYQPPVRVGAFTYVDPATKRGTVAGIVALNGGPAPGTGEYVTSGAVTFDSESDGYSASIGQDGSFEIELPAGEYGVTIRSPQWNGGAPYSYGRFDATGGELSELNVILPVR
jgi:hypothetical protein